MTSFTRTFSAFAAMIVTALLAIAPLATPSMASNMSVSGHQRPHSDNVAIVVIGGAMDGSVAA